MKTLEFLFERILWNTRLIVLVAVIASLVTSIAVFYVATADVYYLLSHLVEYTSPALESAARAKLRSSSISHVVEVVDGYLLATVLLIFAFGLYELFISKIDEAEGGEVASKVLVIHSLDDLKARLSKVILMILIVKFFEHAIGMEFANPIQLLYLAAGIALIGLALYLGHAGKDSKRQHDSA